ncbi:hypothetical protein BS17DRAFT_766187 [Gyrodon lividus]|nr:hypothetical protein BS17DRAFT_766187 [Gyrodon lividus]
MSALRTFALFLFISAAAAQTVQYPSDPYLDPYNYPCNALRYIYPIQHFDCNYSGWFGRGVSSYCGMHPNLLRISSWYQMNALNGHWRIQWVLLVTWISAGSTLNGTTAYALGFGIHDYPDSLAIYIVEYLYIILSPCAFIAVNYVLLGRLSRNVSCGAHVLVPAHRLTLIFVLSDVTTFLIQAAGGGLTVSNNYNTALMGAHTMQTNDVLCLATPTIILMEPRFMSQLELKGRSPYAPTCVNYRSPIHAFAVVTESSGRATTV